MEKRRKSKKERDGARELEERREEWRIVSDEGREKGEVRKVEKRNRRWSRKEK